MYDIFYNVCTCVNSIHTFIYVVMFKWKFWTPAPYSLLTHHLNIVKLINIANLDNGSVQFVELIYSEHRYWDDRHGGYKPTHHYGPGRVCVCAIIRRNKPHAVDHQHALSVQNICPVSTEYMPCQYIIYALSIQNICPVNTEYIPCQYIIYALSVHNICPVSK